MNPWIRPWEPLIPLIKWIQVASLAGTMSQLWQTVLAALLPLLVITYYVFLVIDASPWRRPDGQSHTKASHSQQKHLPTLSYRRRKRR